MTTFGLIIFSLGGALMGWLLGVMRVGGGYGTARDMIFGIVMGWLFYIFMLGLAGNSFYGPIVTMLDGLFLIVLIVERARKSE